MSINDLLYQLEEGVVKVKDDKPVVAQTRPNQVESSRV